MEQSAKIKSRKELAKMRRTWDLEDRCIVFTNGCFDIIHRGHVEYLQKARQCGDILIVGLNGDASVTRLKGPARPLMPVEDRAVILSALEMVDYVVVFHEDTPYDLIRAVQPDILVKGGDYKIEEIVGKDIVEARGGKVMTIPMTPDRSTSNVVQRVIELVKKGILV